MTAQVVSSNGFASFADYYQNGPLAHFQQEHRRGGSFQVSMLMVDQEPSEFFDPAMGEISIVGLLTPNCRAELDFGNGWTPRGTFGVDFVRPQPSLQECGFRIADSHRILAAYAPAAFLSEQFDRAGILSDPFAPLYGHLAHSPIQMYFLKAMWAAMEAGGHANNLLIDGLYTALLGHMMGGLEQHSFVVAPDVDNRQLAKVIDYIEAHFDTPLLTSELAAIAVMSIAQFGRAFKAATGYSPHHYVTLRRVEHAKHMLRANDLTITQIAYCCGFSSAAHFATVFGRHAGAPPSVYRAALQV
jgi:AraC family transcriptional regulator